jgi:Ca-activated chloride channel family protein
MSFKQTNEKKESSSLDSVSMLDSLIESENNKLRTLAPRLFRSTDDQNAKKMLDLFKRLYIAQYAGDNEYGLPKYDEYSMMARRVSFFLYDCPLFTSAIGCDTAFVTNGDHVFFHADFFKKLVDWEQQTAIEKNGVKKRTEQNVDFILTHELGHASAGHVELFLTMPLESKLGALNAGTDTWLNLNYAPMFNINENLKGEFNNELGIVVKGCYGLTEEERNYFSSKDSIGIISDTSIIKHYAEVFSNIEKMKKSLQDQQQNQNGQQSQQNQQSTQNGQQGQQNQQSTQNGQQGQQNQQSTQNGQQGQQNQQGAQNKQSQQNDYNSDASANEDGSNTIDEKIKKAIDAVNKAKSNANSDKHVVSTEDLAKALEQSGHGKFKDDILKLPDSHDSQAHQELQTRAKTDAITDHHSVKNMIKEYEERTGQKYSGGHIHQCMTELIKRRHAVPDTDLNMEDQILNNILPGGQDMIYSEETPDDYFYIDPQMLGQEYHINKGSDIYINRERAVIAIFDTSGSMSSDYLSQVSASMQGIIEGDNPITKAYVLHADTVARTEFIEVSDDNASEYFTNLEVFGRGGTDLQNAICSAIAIANDEEIYHEIAGVIVLTDTFDTAPRKDEMEQIVESITGFDELPPIVYVVPQNINVESFSLQVQDHGSVVVYSEKKMDLDFDLTNSNQIGRSGL